MGNFMSRQNAAVEEADPSTTHAYKYPPRVGNFFGSHFIMGGERFDTPQPESYLFGENADLNFLGNRPTAFPYPPPQANEPTKTLKSLVNIRKESVRFVRVPNEKKLSSSIDSDGGIMGEEVDGNVLCGLSISGLGGGDNALTSPSCSYNIEFTFDSDAKCAITIYYFCNEEVSPSGVTLVPRDGLTSETYHYDKGINQYFSQPTHIFNPQLIPEDDLIYNPIKEQYPVAIHCIVEEGNEDCRQSHTTICVIDHHPESNTYVLRALKQKIFVDGLCYLLQEIYGIENKAVNKSSIDEEIDDHGSECVICMSETRDTLILPCRHLCLCNSCADSLRYQANNCPICRAPFRALLQIRAVQKGISTHMLHQNTATSVAGESAACDVPPGYVPVSLIEALNGPPQFVGRSRNVDVVDVTDCVSAISNDNNKATSPLKPNNQRRPKIKKNASTCTSNNESCASNGSINITNGSSTAVTATAATATVTTITTSTNTASNIDNNNITILSVVEIEHDKKKSTATGITTSSSSPVSNKASQDKLQIVNERHSLKLSKQKRHSGSSGSGNNQNASAHETITAAINIVDEDDDDSENEKLSPLLSPGSNKKCGVPQTSKTLKQVVADLSAGDDSQDDTDDNELIHDDEVHIVVEQNKKSTSLKKQKRSDLSASATAVTIADADTGIISNMVGDYALAANLNAEDSDYYTPEDTQNSILSPLCPAERAKCGEQLCGNNCGGNNNNSSHNNNGHKPSSVGGGVVIGFSNAGNLVKKNLHKKSTSVGNIAGPNTGGGSNDLKCNNVSSLPDMLDSPISGNSASTRSSSDSYSSSSSTKQLLSSTNQATTVAANIIVDDKTALQNAVNV